jgi:hypothetical protein
VAGSPQCSIAFGAIEEPLRAVGAVRDGRIGAARSQLMSGQAIIDATFRLLEKKPDILLCTDTGCYVCREARQMLAHTPAKAPGATL